MGSSSIRSVCNTWNHTGMSTAENGNADTKHVLMMPKPALPFRRHHTCTVGPSLSYCIWAGDFWVEVEDTGTSLIPLSHFVMTVSGHRSASQELYVLIQSWMSPIIPPTHHLRIWYAGSRFSSKLLYKSRPRAVGIWYLLQGESKIQNCGRGHPTSPSLAVVQVSRRPVGVAIQAAPLPHSSASCRPSTVGVARQPDPPTQQCCEQGQEPATWFSAQPWLWNDMPAPPLLALSFSKTAYHL